MTAGFFVVHGVASGWVPVRASAGGVAAAQAASLYLFAYYLGSSVFGGLAAVSGPRGLARRGGDGPGPAGGVRGPDLWLRQIPALTDRGADPALAS